MPYLQSHARRGSELRGRQPREESAPIRKPRAQDHQSIQPFVVHPLVGQPAHGDQQKKRGEAQDRPRVKFTSIEAMVDAIHDLREARAEG